MKPTHKLKILIKDEPNTKAEIGAGWLNEDGHITIQLNPCVVLKRDKNVVINLFPINKDGDKQERKTE